jgi:protein ImuB
VDLRVGLFQPTAIAEHLHELLDMQLERLRLPEAVSRAAITATRIAPLIQRQHELFADEPRERRRQFAVLIDRLSSRLGMKRVVRPRRRAEAQPEAAVAYEPLTKLGVTGTAGSRARSRRASKPASRRVRPSMDAASPRPIAPRPLRLFGPPLPIEVMAAAPAEPPTLIRLADQSYAVVQHWGPERIETAWWRGRTIRRDYYRIETAAGSRLWIFRRLADDAWFLHGEFE